MRYINLNEEMNNMDAHVLAGRLADIMPRGPWGYLLKPINVAAVAAFVEDLAEVVDDLNEDELYMLLAAADEVQDLDAYQAAYVCLRGYEDPYIEMEWSGVWMGD